MVIDHQPEITPAQWEQLIALRHCFLTAQGGLSNYWDDEQLMKAYDATLAHRILFKWQAVLELIAQRFTLEKALFALWDWGCGTGMAARAVTTQFADQFQTVHLSDRSAAVVRFAEKKLREISPIVISSAPTSPNNTLFLASHVFSELDAHACDQFERDAAVNAAILLLESGRPYESKRLSALRERFIARGFRALAPCPHNANCGMLSADRHDDWCHFFAKPPHTVGQSSFWRHCAKRLGIDLRSLPVSYLFMAKEGVVIPRNETYTKDRLMLARGRRYKGYTAYQACTPSGIIDARIQKRDDRAMYEQAESPELTGYF